MVSAATIAIWRSKAADGAQEALTRLVEDGTLPKSFSTFPRVAKAKREVFRIRQMTDALRVIAGLDPINYTNKRPAQLVAAQEYIGDDTDDEVENDKRRRRWAQRALLADDPSAPVEVIDVPRADVFVEGEHERQYVEYPEYDYTSIRDTGFNPLYPESQEAIEGDNPELDENDDEFGDDEIARYGDDVISPKALSEPESDESAQGEQSIDPSTKTPEKPASAPKSTPKKPRKNRNYVAGAVPK